ncbi:hypothetical protein AN639_01605 [Candidatus Epulonipiscium fishelsonii]|uniref:Uncharacterized protein n=1 Tax=Candidatus Epulonipiscium fishelsonii TaxID=77094 RepID=A0ACC8XBD4_9FIRM|nr:hypothetical protein AN639_01605 [Epulopiscium sp. SCG-B05WGA-EpuloA1]ONI39702.1 hypothetical protein AN396_07470 [Epulopiscium sp. SCG-B11WGA-EpuloA1]
MKITISMLVLLILIVGCIFLQIFLSKQQNKWLGIILPIITFSFSVLMTIIYLLSFMAGTPIWQVLSVLLLVFVLHNIPTVVLCVIYKVCRKKMSVNIQL